jgi:hypothetical protein
MGNYASNDTVITGSNADMLDGYHAVSFAFLVTTYTKGEVDALVSGPVGDADKLDGQHGSYYRDADKLDGQHGSYYAPIDSPSFTTKITSPYIYGSSAANGDLIIEGTDHATKISSYVLMQQSGGCVGIGFATPLSVLSINGGLHVGGESDAGDNNLIVDGTSLITGVATFGNDLGTASFASGFAGSGWKMDLDTDYTLTVDNLVVRKALTAYELNINKINSVNGGIIVSVANGKCLNVSGTTIYFDEDGTNKQIQFVVDDYIRAQEWTGRGIGSYIGRVTAVNHSTTYGAASIVATTISGTPWNGMDLVQVGHASIAARQNLIYITASDTNNPYIDMLAGVTDGDFTGHQKLRIGNLSGITDVDFGGALSGYGLYANNIYLKGSIIMTGGSVPNANVSGLGSLAVKSSVDLSTGDVTNKSLANVDSTANTKLSGIAAGATVGATWGSNLYSVPGYLGTPGSAGLYISSTYMGYYNGSSWLSYIDSSGNCKFVGIAELGTGTAEYGGLTTGFALKHSDLYEPGLEGDGSKLHINRIGFNGGTDYFRMLGIYDGKGNEMIEVNGETSYVTLKSSYTWVTGRLHFSGTGSIVIGEFNGTPETGQIAMSGGDLYYYSGGSFRKLSYT